MMVKPSADADTVPPKRQINLMASNKWRFKENGGLRSPNLLSKDVKRRTRTNEFLHFICRRSVSLWLVDTGWPFLRGLRPK